MKIVSSIALIMLTQLFFGQSVFDKYDGKEEVSVVTINKKIFDLMSKVKMDTSDKDTQLYLNLIKRLDNLKTVTTQNSRIENDMIITVEKHQKTNGLEELLNSIEEGKKIKLFVKSGATGNQLKELLIFIEGDKQNETILLSLTGDFSLNELSVLTDKMKIPVGDVLKKVSKEAK
jgi:Domain of unknown function (DUF4252)